jgi:hypothetical protein
MRGRRAEPHPIDDVAGRAAPPHDRDAAGPRRGGSGGRPGKFAGLDGPRFDRLPATPTHDPATLTCWPPMFTWIAGNASFRTWASTFNAER